MVEKDERVPLHTANATTCSQMRASGRLRTTHTRMLCNGLARAHHAAHLGIRANSMLRFSQLHVQPLTSVRSPHM
eukprot:3127350-Pleurochrysis_carterae.AAC.1